MFNKKFANFRMYNGCISLSKKVDVDYIQLLAIIEMKILYTLILSVILSLNCYSQWQKGHHLHWTEREEKIYTSINDAMKFPDSVEVLDLSGQELSKIPDEIYEMRNLKELYLGIIQYIGAISTNEISKLPNELFQLEKLEILDLGQNKFSNIPPDIKDLRSLRILNLRGNPVKELPAEIGLLGKLEILDLGFTKIKELPSEFGELKTLKRLHIDYTEIKHLPQSTTKLTSLEYIHMFGPETIDLAETIDFLSVLPNFTELDLPIISKIPDNIVNLKKLRQLNIYQHGFKNYKKPLETISKIESLRGLRLYYYGSKVNLPSEIGLIKQLELLELLFYGGISLPEEISNLSNLKNFGFIEHVQSGLEYINKDCRKY